MTLFLIIGIVAVLLVGTAIVVYSINKKKYKGNILNAVDKAKTAMSELDGLLNVTHLFSSEEERQYRSNYRDLDTLSMGLISSSYANGDEVKPMVQILKQFRERFKKIAELRKKNNQLNQAYVSIVQGDLLTKAIDDMDAWESGSKYFTESRKNAYRNYYKVVVDVIALAAKNAELANAIGHKEDYARLTSFYNNIDARKQAINARYVQQELIRNAEYFDDVLRFPLSKQQRNAAVYDEDNVLVISSAGSGKTFTMEGKVKYLIEQRGVSPSNILLLTFTRKAAESLHQRVGVEEVTCSTFDALANKIVTEHDGHRPSISDDINVREEVFNSLMQDRHFVNAVARYLMMFATDPQAELDVESAEEMVEVRRATDRRTLLPNMDGNVVFTKSEQERLIGDILARNGIKYRYEESYEYNVSDSEYRQYKPDFSIHYEVDEKYEEVDENGNIVERVRKVQKRIYLEHFGIDVFGKVPKWFVKANQTWEDANKSYHDGIVWKRNLHSQKGTVLLETTSGDFQMLGPNEVEEKLIGMLSNLGVPIQPLSSEKIFELINSSNPQRCLSVKQMLSSFISLLKGGCHDIHAVIKDVRQEYQSYTPDFRRFGLLGLVDKKKEKEKQREHLRRERDLYILTDMVLPYYAKYQETLHARHELDFTDVVLTATQYNSSRNKKRYDYILIDEFQDLSIARYKFVQSLRSDIPFQTKLFCVGDDWQSIYRFAGSDLTLFNDFSSHFGFVEKCKIEMTYRFGEPLMSLSSAFVMENPSQVKKDVTSLPNCHTELTCIPYQFDWRDQHVSRENLYVTICNILNNVSDGETVYFLGRYKFDADTLKDIGFRLVGRGDRFVVQYNGKQIVFMTVHQAKGLEADHIILLNCNDGTYGFPSAIEDDPILSYVLSEQEQFKFAEERRLFYVAITRAKKHTYILYDENRPSYFLKDFITRDEGEYGFCPLCHTGHVVRFQQRTVRNGNTMTEFRCSNERYGCLYNHVQWENRPQAQDSIFN